MRKLVSLFLALCLMCAAVPAFAEMQEVKIGSVTFQIPAEQEVVNMRETTATYDGPFGTIHLVAWTIEDDMIESLMKACEEVGEELTYHKAVVEVGEMFGGGFDPTHAVAGLAEEEQIGMLNGIPVMSTKWGFMQPVAFYAQAYRGMYYSVFVTSESLDKKMLEETAKMIMLTIRLDDVSEEDMIADHMSATEEMEAAAPEADVTADDQADSQSDAQADYVIITADSGKIRTEASISGGLIKTAYKGETYELIEKSGDWYVIKVDGRTGYLHSGVAKIQ